MNEYSIYSLAAATGKPWSGGETFELFIYPEVSTYKARNFRIRISVARASIDYSEYTSLPNVTRHLVALVGSASLTHSIGADTRTFQLEQQKNVDVFSGDEHTTAQGAITDYNVMLNGGAIAETAICRDMFTIRKCDLCAIFAWDGNAEIELPTGKCFTLQNASLAVMSSDCIGAKITVKSGIVISSHISL